ncbi:hypothetical protein BDV3_006658 [Batrachochytrium dendrobatidis]
MANAPVQDFIPSSNSSGRTFAPTIRRSSSSHSLHATTGSLSVTTQRRQSSNIHQPRPVSEMNANHSMTNPDYSQRQKRSSKSGRNRTNRRSQNVIEVSSSPSTADTASNELDRDAISATGEPSSYLVDKSLADQPLVPNKRGQVSLNHLINFSFPPRQQTIQTVLGGSSSPLGDSSTAARRRKKEYIEPFNKQRFVNANFRFILTPDNNYQAPLSDPDIIIEWEDIDQVVLLSSALENSSICPICLSIPAAPRVAKCGHVFCWPCIRHYLVLGEKAWRKCPICYDSVYAPDLKSVCFVEGGDAISRRFGHSSPLGCAGKTVTFTLMKRMIGSTIALPRHAFSKWNNRAAPPCVMTRIQSMITKDDEHVNSPTDSTASITKNQDAMLFGRMMVSTPEYMLHVAQQDRDMLAQLLKEHIELTTKFKGTPGIDSERPFLDSCIMDIEKIIAGGGTIRATPQPRGKQQPFMARYQTSVSTQQHRPHQNDRISKTEKILPTPNTRASTTSPVHSQTSQAPYMYFYQSADGQLTFLHPLDVRILKSAYGEYELFPDTLTLKLISAQESTMTTDLRKRCKYLCHLPLSCDVTFCQVELDGVVEASVLEQFSKEIASRAARLTKHIQEAEKASQMIANASGTDYNTTGVYHSNSGGASNLQDSAWLQQSFGGAEVVGGSQSADGSDRNMGSLSRPLNGGSFADMAAVSSARRATDTPSSWLPGDDWGVDDRHGWADNLESQLMDTHIGESSITSGGNRSKRGGKKSVLLVSNGGARSR